ncbi:uncharacterized protein VP01_7912g1, partial [Puccinia sorghi]
MADNEGAAGKANIPKLDKKNFLHWSMRMKAHLRHRGLIKYVLETPSPLSDSTPGGIQEVRQILIMSALIHESSKKEEKGARKKKHVYCKPGKRNPALKTHDEDHCYQVHPHLRPAHFGSQLQKVNPTTQLVK